jgi:hypothetical protein
LEVGEDLQKECKKKRSGEVTINWKKYVYFLINNWITLLNKKTELEITFHFNIEKDYIYFEKNKFHNFIESDLNSSGLWKNFTSNKISRPKEFDECLDKLCSSGKIIKKDKWFLISIEELN